MARAYLGLGSNLGHRVENLYRAVQLLTAKEGIKLCAASSLYETAPVGYVEQRWFLNAVIEVETVLAPQALLDRLHTVEKQMKRVRAISWGPRIIDIDILLYATCIIQREELHIPHPELVNRAFVLIPLHEIAPALVLPTGERLSELLGNLPGQIVKYYAPFCPLEKFLLKK